MRAAAYARYSTDRQTENSIVYQLDEIRDYCREHEIPIVATYTDEGCSGTNADRAGFQAMCAAAKAGVIDAVVVYDISRGSRDVGDWFSFRKSMLYLGVQVISATGQQLGDLTNGQDFLLELLTVGMGQAEVLGTRQKSIDGVAVKAKEGAFLGGTPPLGYDIVGASYVINPQEAAVVRKIFEWYAAGRSYNYIIDHLDGALGKKGRPIGKNSLNSILSNERYIGVYTWNKRKCKLFRRWAGGGENPNMVRIEGVIPPIVDLKTWEKVRERMSNAKRNASNKARRRSYLLSGLIECSCCGSAYVGHTSTNKKGYQTSYYVCGNKYRTRECKAKNINAAEIEEFVIQHLKAYLLDIDLEETAQVIADAVNSASPDLGAEKAELAQIETQLANGVRAILSGVQIPELEAEMSRLRGRKAELEDVITRATANRAQVDPAAIVALLQEDIETWDDARLPEIIRHHVQKIYAHEDGSYEVHMGVHMSGCGGLQYVLCATYIRPAA